MLSNLSHTIVHMDNKMVIYIQHTEINWWGWWQLIWGLLLSQATLDPPKSWEKKHLGVSITNLCWNTQCYWDQCYSQVIAIVLGIGNNLLPICSSKALVLNFFWSRKPIKCVHKYFNEEYFSKFKKHTIKSSIVLFYTV